MDDVDGEAFVSVGSLNIFLLVSPLLFVPGLPLLLGRVDEPSELTFYQSLFSVTGAVSHSCSVFQHLVSTSSFSVILHVFLLVFQSPPLYLWNCKPFPPLSASSDLQLFSDLCYFPVDVSCEVLVKAWVVCVHCLHF